MKKLLIALTLLCFWSCKKEEAPEPTPTVKTGILMFHLHAYIDLEEVDLYGIEYHTSGDRAISLDMAQLYISDIQVVKSDGSLYNVSNKILLQRLEDHTYTVGQLPVGNYKSIRFKVGLAPAVNALAPTASADSAMLNLPDMWLGSTPQPDGYVFMNAQGKIDTSADLSHPPVPFIYKIGTDAHYVQVDLGEKNFTVEEDNAIFSHIIVDYSKLFNGISLKDAANLSVKTASDNNSALAQKIAANIPAMFIYE